MTLPKRTYVSVNHVAEFLGCSDRTVRRLLESGNLKGFKLGEGKRSGLRIRRDSVLEFVAGKEAEFEFENGIFQEGQI